MHTELEKQTGEQNTEAVEYPVASMAVCMILIYLSPFTSPLVNYLAFGICLYRIVRYEESVFAVDYCALAGVSYIFLSSGRVSLLAWLSIAASAWYVVKKGIQGNAAFLLLVLLLDYMLFRIQGAFDTFVLCFSQLVLLFVLLSGQKKQGIVKCMFAFCGNVLVSSVYALLFRNTYQIRSLLGNEVPAYWGSSFSRFQGLFRDPNYYMTMLAVSIALFAVLYVNQYLSGKAFLTGTAGLVLFGALTYSKTFILVLLIFVALFVAMLFYRKKYFLGICSLVLIVMVGTFLARTIFSVTIYRITSTDNLYDLTTGRSELFLNYFEEMTSSVSSLFLGAGLSAEILRRGTHNLFMEIIYDLGLIGFALFIAYTVSLLRLTIRRLGGGFSNTNGLFRYMVLIIYLILFCTLQGMTFAITYIMLYLSIVSTVIAPCQRPARSESVKEDGKS